MKRSTLVAVLVPCAAFAAPAALASPPAPVPRPVVVLMMPLRSLGLDRAVVARLDDLVRAEAKAIPGLAVVHASEAKDRLAAALNASPDGCEGNPGCAAALGRAVGAQRVLTGVAAGLGEAYVVTLKLVDVDSGTEMGRTQETLSGSQDRLIHAARAASYRVLAPELYVGGLALRCAALGAHVAIDGKPAGKTPLPGPIVGLRPDKHALRITKEGFRDFEQFIEVHFGATTVVEVDLRSSKVTGEFIEVIDASKAAAPAVATRVVAAKAALGVKVLAGAGAALAAGALGMGVATYVGRSQAQAECRPGACTPKKATAWNARNDTYENVGIGLVAGSVATLGAALVLHLAGVGAPAPAVAFLPLAGGGAVAVRWSLR